MFIRWIFAALHLLALGLGLGAVLWRARGLDQALDVHGVRRVLFADNLWGMAALLWIVTGLVRVFASLEKPSGYYLASSVFWIKMGLLLLVLLLEIQPAITFVRWRMLIARGERDKIDTSRVPLFLRTSRIQAALIILMIFAATAMARGMNF